MNRTWPYEENLFHINTPPNSIDHIRLLRPLRGSDNWLTTRSSALRNLWQLQVFSLRKAPAFAALSYSWGNRPANVWAPVVINNILRGFHISDDLSDCMYCLRDSNECDWLWIDALCINQVSNDEKSNQVAMMKSIYEQANRVLVWLGKFKTIIRTDHDDTGGIPNPSPPMISSEERRRGGISMVKLVELSNQGPLAWFSRLWVIQEFASSREVFMCIGSCVTPWEEFRKIMNSVGTLMEAQPVKNPSADRIAVIQLLSEFRRLANLRDNIRAYPGGQQLVTLLKATSSSGVSKPEDRIYSLLGMATEQDRRNIVVDYNRRIADIFCDVVRNDVSTSNSLEILFQGWERRARNTLKSVGSRIDDGGALAKRFTFSEDRLVLSTWMPDFLRPCGEKMPWLRFHQFNASKRMDPRVRFQSMSLFMDAVVCGEILEAFTLANISMEFNEHPEETEARQISIFHRTIQRKWTKILVNLPNDTRHALPEASALTETFKLVRDMRSLSSKRAICFITSCGFVGLTEDPLYCGDEVIGPFGSSVPAIVRSSFDAYLPGCSVHALVGACYVHGIMDGELITLWRERKVEAREYHLR